MRVSLITTGEMEHRALALSLQSIFPGHSFFPESMSPGRPFHGFTSARVGSTQPGGPTSIPASLLRGALDALIPRRSRPNPADFAVVLDDLEVCNLGNEQAVIDLVRNTATSLIASQPSPNRAYIAGLLKDRVSFHLAAPMTESWFYGDPSGLAGELPPSQSRPCLAAGRDPEDFLVDDPAFMQDQCVDCAKWHALNCPNRWRPAWLTSLRERHPKAYLSWLLRDPTQAKCSKYSESHEGVRLLAALRWCEVLGDPNSYPFARALIRDLEAALCTPAAGVPLGGIEAPLTSLQTACLGRVLRNL